jgi:hypothetical protein
LVEIALNDDWASAQQRLAAFWEREVVDRPCLQVYVRAAGPDVETAVDPQQYWTEPAAFFAVEQARYLRAGYLGEAFPVLYSNYRVVPSLAGAVAEYAPDTIWYHPLAGSLAEIDLSGFSPAHPAVQRMAAILAYAAERGAGECFVGLPALGNSGDELAMLRNWQRFCYDLRDDIETVIRLDAEVTQIWKILYDLFYGIINQHMEGSCGWLPAWHPRRSALIEFDLGGLVGPEHFRRFIPHLLERAGHVEHAIYHLDGRGALPHLETLLALPEIHAIQAQPGSGGGDILSWLPVLRKIQSAGKCLYVGYTCEPALALRLLEELRPEGLIIPVEAGDEASARQFLEEVARRF